MKMKMKWNETKSWNRGWTQLNDKKDQELEGNDKWKLDSSIRDQNELSFVFYPRSRKDLIVYCPRSQPRNGEFPFAARNARHRWFRPWSAMLVSLSHVRCMPRATAPTRSKFAERWTTRLVSVQSAAPIRSEIRRKGTSGRWRPPVISFQFIPGAFYRRGNRERVEGQMARVLRTKAIWSLRGGSCNVILSWSCVGRSSCGDLKTAFFGFFFSVRFSFGCLAIFPLCLASLPSLVMHCPPFSISILSLSLSLDPFRAENFSMTTRRNFGAASGIDRWSLRSRISRGSWRWTHFEPL